MRMTKIEICGLITKDSSNLVEIIRKKYKDQRRMALENLVIKGHDFPRVTSSHDDALQSLRIKEGS